jgi:hypothetical protein
VRSESRAGQWGGARAGGGRGGAARAGAWACTQTRGGVATGDRSGAPPSRAHTRLTHAVLRLGGTRAAHCGSGLVSVTNPSTTTSDATAPVLDTVREAVKPAPAPEGATCTQCNDRTHRSNPPRGNSSK